MKINTLTVKHYTLSEEEVNTLLEVEKLLDELYDNCESGEGYESDFLRARDDIDYLISELRQDGGEAFWEERCILTD